MIHPRLGTGLAELQHSGNSVYPATRSIIRLILLTILCYVVNAAEYWKKIVVMINSSLVAACSQCAQVVIVLSVSVLKRSQKRIQRYTPLVDKNVEGKGAKVLEPGSTLD